MESSIQYRILWIIDFLTTIPRLTVGKFVSTLNDEEFNVENI